MNRPGTIWNTLKTLVNSPFGIWFLSSAVLGTLSIYYAHFQQCIQDADQFRGEYYSLVQELNGRRKQLMASLNAAHDPFDAEAEVRKLDAIDRKNFADVPLQGIFWKLHR